MFEVFTAKETLPNNTKNDILFHCIKMSHYENEPILIMKFCNSKCNSLINKNEKCIGHNAYLSSFHCLNVHVVYANGWLEGLRLGSKLKQLTLAD